MNRRDFLLVSAAVTALPFAALAAMPAAMPPIEYTWLPPKQDASDPWGQHGYCGGVIDVRGKRYANLYSFSKKTFDALGEDETKRQMYELVSNRLRAVFAEIA